MSDSFVNQQLDELADLLDRLNDRLVIEDGWAWRYRLVSTLVIGRATDDPGIQIKIEQQPRHPDV